MEELSTDNSSDTANDEMSKDEEETAQMSDPEDTDGISLEYTNLFELYLRTMTIHSKKGEELGSFVRVLGPLFRQKRCKNNKEAMKYYKMAEKSIVKGTTEKLCRKAKNKNCTCCQDLFGVPDFETAIELLTKSIAHAVPESPVMSLAFLLRAQTLFKLRYFEECLVDLNRIQFEKVKINQQMKAINLKAECFTELAEYNFKEAKHFLRHVPINDGSRLHLKKKLRNYSDLKHHLREKALEEPITFKEIKSPNEKFPCASNAIDIKYSEELGRHIVATRDIDVGELLVVEEPYSAITSIEKPYKYCWYCSKGVWTGIPCDHCVNIVFCSEKCKTAGWTEFHGLECTILDLSLDDPENIWTVQVLFTGLRIMLKAVHDAGGISNLKERLANLIIEKPPDWIINEGLDQPESYSFDSILSLASLNGNADRHDFVHGAEMALIIVFLLATCTDFFGLQYDKEKICNNDLKTFQEISKNNDIQFFGKLLTLLPMRNQILYLKVMEYVNFISQSRGYATYTFSNQFNNSCYSNTIKVFKGNQLNIYSSLPIKKNEQVTIEYSDDNPINQMKIKCTCTTCKHDWRWTECKSYKEVSKSAEWKLKIEEALTKFSQVEKEIYEDDYDDKAETLQKLCNIVRIVYEGVNLPCCTLVRIVQSLRLLLSRTGNLSKSFKHSAHVVGNPKFSIFDD